MVYLQIFNEQPNMQRHSIGIQYEWDIVLGGVHDISDESHSQPTCQNVLLTLFTSHFIQDEPLEDEPLPLWFQIFTHQVF